MNFFFQAGVLFSTGNVKETVLRKVYSENKNANSQYFVIKFTDLQNTKCSISCNKCTIPSTPIELTNRPTKTPSTPNQSINQSIFILQNNPLGFSNQRRLDRATDQSNVTQCSSQYKTDSSIPIGSPFSMSALLRIYSVTAETGERPGGHLAITQTTQGRTICNSSSSSGSKGGGCAPPGAGEE